MAKVKVEMPEEFLRKLSLLGSKTDEIAGRVLEAGGEVVLSKVRSNLSSVIGSSTKYDSRKACSSAMIRKLEEEVEKL